MRNSAFGIFQPLRKLLILSADVVCILTSFSLASKVRLGYLPNFQSFEFLGLGIILISSFFVGGTYTSSTITSKPRLPLHTFFVVVAAALPCTLFIYLLGPERFNTLLGRGVFPFAILLLGLLLATNRFVINYLFAQPNQGRNILFLGDPLRNKQIDKLFDVANSQITLSHSNELTTANWGQHDADAIVVCPDHNPAYEEQQLLVNLRIAGIPIFSLSDFFENFFSLIPVEYVDNNWFIRAEGFTMLRSAVTTRLKNTLDKVAATLLLLLTSPILLLAACLIKVFSRGPVIFSQARVGIQGETFTLFKLRTMNQDAEIGGAKWAETDDPRVIPFGRFLRRTRIDEIPQCWNILRGEMSFIGPRPERPEFTNTLAAEIPYYDLRHLIKPGLTGWAQVNYPYGASKSDALRKLQYDLYYIKNYSLLLDLNILLRTVLVTLNRAGR